ncbi:unnamed protein product [Protopolystoma xenopodis]|uniref:Uncharacterized protein n=1 Tax=Protopolystoma xenopodis TaxID=117903 RepID=A0A3S5AHA5_9PLAT|nr:unnamed protein product [Protopolystoma xenopodis]
MLIILLILCSVVISLLLILELVYLVVVCIILPSCRSLTIPWLLTILASILILLLEWLRSWPLRNSVPSGWASNTSDAIREMAGHLELAAESIRQPEAPNSGADSQVAMLGLSGFGHEQCYSGYSTSIPAARLGALSSATPGYMEPSRHSYSSTHVGFLFLEYLYLI